MHTTDTTDNTDTTIAETNTATKISIARRAALILAIVFALSAGLSVATGSPASAATAGDVTFCLRYSNSTAYTSKPVYLYYAAPNATSWTKWKSGSTNASGCATWRGLPTGYHYLTQGYWTYNVGPSGYYYTGYTGSAWLSSYGGTVTQARGTVQGPYRLY